MLSDALEQVIFRPKWHKITKSNICCWSSTLGWRALSDKAAAEIYDMKGLWVKKKKKDPQQMLSVTPQNNSNQELESEPFFFISSIAARISDPARWQDTKAPSSRACKFTAGRFVRQRSPDKKDKLEFLSGFSKEPLMFKNLKSAGCDEAVRPSTSQRVWTKDLTLR